MDVDIFIQPKFKSPHINNNLIVFKCKSNLYYFINIFKKKMRVIINTLTIVLQYKCSL